MYLSSSARTLDLKKSPVCLMYNRNIKIPKMGHSLSLSLVPEHINMAVFCMSSFELLGTRCPVLRFQVGTAHLRLQNITAGRNGSQTACEVTPPPRSNLVMFWSQCENFVCRIWNSLITCRAVSKGENSTGFTENLMEVCWLSRWNAGPRCQARPEDPVHRRHQHPV